MFTVIERIVRNPLMRPAMLLRRAVATGPVLMLISAGGQVVRTQTNSINRYSSGARGVIVMRLNEGDRVVGIAAFRAGLAGDPGMGDDGHPSGAGDGPDGTGKA